MTILAEPAASLAIARSLHALLSGHAPLPNSAAGFMARVATVLRLSGWNVRTEVVVPSRGTADGYRGRIDIVAERAGQVLAIECDTKSPRIKSVHKLAHYAADARIVILRTPQRLERIGTSPVLVFGVEVRS